jgi:hypothetical protein
MCACVCKFLICANPNGISLEQEEKARLAQQKMQKIDGGREKEEDHYGHGCCIIM